MRKIIEFFTGKKERFYLCLTNEYEHFKYFPLIKGKIYSEQYTSQLASVGFYVNDNKKGFKRLV
jgi:hypothetical protein